jgi:5-methylcytosine-specific restriction endonuclease McrA
MEHCRYCGTNQNLTKDHIIPLSRGGNNSRSNIQTLCSKCNGNKSNYTDREIAYILNDIQKRGVLYRWEKKKAQWLEYIKESRNKYGLTELNFK